MTQLPDNLRIEIDKEHAPLLLFFEHETSPACRWTAPHLPPILQDNPSVRLLRIPAEQYPDLCERFAVPRVPHLCFVRGGQAQSGLTGVYTAVYMRRWLEEQLQRE